MGPASFVRNSSTTFLARTYGLAVGGALSIYAARSFSLEEFGNYSLALAFVTIFSLLSEAGISPLALREMTAAPRRGPAILGTALVAEVVTSAAAVALLLPIALLLGYGGDILLLLAIGGGVIFAQGLFAPLEAAFAARRVQGYAALAIACQFTVTALAAVALVSLGAEAAGLVGAILVGSGAGALAAGGLLRWRLALRPSAAGARAEVGPFLRAALPIAVTGALAVVYERLDVVLLSQLDGAEAVALYTVPFLIVQAFVLLVPAVVGITLYPLLTAAMEHDRPLARTRLLLLLRLTLLGGVPVAIVLALGAEDLLRLVFGDRYGDAAGTLRLLSATTVLAGVSLLLLYALLAARLERRAVRAMVAALGLNVVANAILIPRYGPEGAAAALVASDVAMVVALGALVRRLLFGLPLARLLAAPAAAGLAAALAALALGALPAPASAAACALLYGAILLATRYVTAEELAPLTSPLRALVRRE